MVSESTGQRPDCTCTGIPIPAADCPVLREFRRLATPQGRALALAEYGAEAKAAANGGRESKGRAAYRLQQLGVPSRSILALGHELDANATVCAARTFMDGSKPFLVLIGTPGVGKSVAAAYVLQEFVRSFRWNEQAAGSNPRPAVYLEAGALTGVTAWDEHHRREMEAARAAQVLVVDDMGDEGTPAGIDAVARLLLHRADNSRRTVITSNLTKAAFAKRYGAALADRLREIAVTPDLQNEQSYRRQS